MLRPFLQRALMTGVKGWTIPGLSLKGAQITINRRFCYSFSFLLRPSISKCRFILKSKFKEIQRGLFEIQKWVTVKADLNNLGKPPSGHCEMEKNNVRKSMTNRVSKAIPVLPLRDVVLFPHMIMPLYVEQQKAAQEKIEFFFSHRKKLRQKIRLLLIFLMWEQLQELFRH